MPIPTLDERCYSSGYVSSDFKGDIPTDQVLHAAGLPLEGRGIKHDRGLYAGNDRFATARMRHNDGIYFAHDGVTIQHKPTSGLIKGIIEAFKTEGANGLTLICEDRTLTDVALSVEGLTDITGLPDAQTPHINAEYNGFPITIITCGR